MRKLLCFLTLFAMLPQCFAAESLTYLYGGTSAIYENNISRTRGNLDIVMADYFHIDANGNAAITKTPDTLFIQARQREGIRVTAFVSNHWSRDYARKAMAKRSSVAATLVGWVKQYGLDGLDVDIENLTEADKNSFTDFIRILRQTLPAGKYLSAAVAANPSKLTTGWHGQYDYAELGRLCDAMLFMTYDQSYESSPAGPVASYEFTEKSITEALKYVPKEKIFMGIPFYGRYWASLNNGGKVTGKAFTVADIDVITKHYASRVWYDDKNHCARASVTVKSTDPAVGLWGGKKLEAGTYDIWYENERSYAERMSLCKKYNIAGIGSWALGQEPERIWTGYRLWAGGVPFTDLGGHWGEEAMAELYEQGILSGVGDGLCAPDATVTRAEICVLLCKLLGIQKADPSSAPAEIKNHWAAPYLWAAIRVGLLKGDGVSYRPGDPVTRAELAAFCYKGLHVPNTIDYSQSFFPDVAPSMWFNNAIVTLRVFSVMSGSTGGLFRPYSGATRAEAASVIYKMLSVERKSFVSAQRARLPSANPPVTDPPVLEPR